MTTNAAKSKFYVHYMFSCIQESGRRVFYLLNGMCLSQFPETAPYHGEGPLTPNPVYMHKTCYVPFSMAWVCLRWTLPLSETPNEKVPKRRPLNRGTLKKIIHFRLGFPLINNPFGGTPFIESPVYIYIYITTLTYLSRESSDESPILW